MHHVAVFSQQDLPHAARRSRRHSSQNQTAAQETRMANRQTQQTRRQTETAAGRAAVRRTHRQTRRQTEPAAGRAAESMTGRQARDRTPQPLGQTGRGCRKPQHAGTRRVQGLLRGCKGAPRKILEELLERGWSVLRSKRHLVLSHEQYRERIILPCTTSDRRAARQSVCMIRRYVGIDLSSCL